MGENTKQQAQQRMQAEKEMPQWAVPLVRICDVIYLYLLLPAILLLLGSLALIALGQLSFPWLLNVVNLLNLFTTLGFLSWTVASYDSFAPGWVGVALAIGLKYGGAYLITLLQSVGAKMAHGAGGSDISARFVEELLNAFTTLAVFLAIVSVVRLIIGFSVQIVKDQMARAERRVARIDTTNTETLKPSFIPRCWQMSRCRPAVRMTCPNYIDRINCWKRRSGCFCDRELANYLVNSIDRKDVQEVIDMQVATSKAEQAAGANRIRGHLKDVSTRSWGLQKKWCYECPLFIEHQDYKYKNLSWISWPITAGIVFAVYSFFDTAYKASMTWLEQVTGEMVKNGVLPSNFTPNNTMDNGFEWILLSVLTLLLMGYVISFTETIFMKWKL